MYGRKRGGKCEGMADGRERDGKKLQKKERENISFLWRTVFEAPITFSLPSWESQPSL